MIITDEIKSLTLDIIEFRQVRELLDLTNPDHCRVYRLLNKQVEANEQRLGTIVAAQLHLKIKEEGNAQGD